MALPLLALGYGAIRGVGALGKWWSQKRHKLPTFGKTAYGQYLTKLSEQGKYSPQAMMNIMSRAGATGGNIAQNERAGIRGWLSYSGMGDSVAGVGMLARPGIEHGRQMTNVARDLETEQELSKRMAQEEYAKEATQWSAARNAQKAQAEEGLWGGLTDAVSTGLGTYMGQRAAETLGVPYGVDPTTAELHRNQMYYGNKQPINLPDFSIMTPQEKDNWKFQMIQRGMDPEELEWLILEQEKRSEPSSSNYSLGLRYGNMFGQGR